MGFIITGKTLYYQNEYLQLLFIGKLNGTETVAKK